MNLIVRGRRVAWWWLQSESYIKQADRFTNQTLSLWEVLHTGQDNTNKCNFAAIWIMFDSHKYYHLTFQYPQFLTLYTGRMLSKCYLDLHLRFRIISEFSIHVNCRLIENWKISPQCGTRIILNLKVETSKSKLCFEKSFSNLFLNFTFLNRGHSFPSHWIDIFKYNNNNSILFQQTGFYERAQSTQLR